MSNDNWGSQGGWDEAGKFEDYGDAEEMDWKVKFTVKDGDTKRILFIDAGAPFYAYFHSTFKVTGTGGKILCPEKNGQRYRCSWCAERHYASKTGCFTVVDMGLVVREDGKKVLRPEMSKKGKEYPRFQKKIMVCGQGNQEKPGVLITLKDDFSVDNDNAMRGYVIDAKRSGKKESSVGNRFEKVELLKGDEAIRAYLLAAGADPLVVNDPGFLQPLVYSKELLFTPAEKMAMLLRGGGAPAGANNGGWGQPSGAAGGAGEAVGSGYGPADDLPF